MFYVSKENRITKQKFEEMYKTKENATRMDLSVGEDLETYIERIKNGKINKDTISKRGERKKSFLLCLLDEEEADSNLKFSESGCSRYTYYIDASKTTKL